MVVKLNHKEPKFLEFAKNILYFRKPSSSLRPI